VAPEIDAYHWARSDVAPCSHGTGSIKLLVTAWLRSDIWGAQRANLAHTGDVAISAAPWRARRASRPAALSGAGRHARRVAKSNVAAAHDVFLDVVVLMSVLMFIALVAGIGILALQSTQLTWLP
jgi:hypothetical protein